MVAGNISLYREQPYGGRNISRYREQPYGGRNMSPYREQPYVGRNIYLSSCSLPVVYVLYFCNFIIIIWIQRTVLRCLKDKSCSEQSVRTPQNTSKKTEAFFYAERRNTTVQQGPDSENVGTLPFNKNQTVRASEHCSNVTERDISNRVQTSVRKLPNTENDIQEAGEYTSVESLPTTEH